MPYALALESIPYWEILALDRWARSVLPQLRAIILQYGLLLGWKRISLVLPPKFPVQLLLAALSSRCHQAYYVPPPFPFCIFFALTAIALLLSRPRTKGSNHYQVITCTPDLYLGCWLQFVYRGSPNQGVDFKYLKKARSKISPDDVYWSFDEKEGWSACSKTCARGMAVEHYRNFFSVYFITEVIYNKYR